MHSDLEMGALFREIAASFGPVVILNGALAISLGMPRPPWSYRVGIYYDSRGKAWLIERTFRGGRLLREKWIRAREYDSKRQVFGRTWQVDWT